MNIVILFLAITISGHEPVRTEIRQDSVYSCLTDAAKFLETSQASHVEGIFEANCGVKIAKSIDN